jgi:SIR2-like domain
MRTLEPPYGVICDLLNKGGIVPFLGAGASVVGRATEEVWRPNEQRFLPSGLELAHFLADQVEFPAGEPQERDDLAKVSSYYVEMVGRRRLRARLRDVLNRSYHPGPLHEFLAGIPAPMVIVVTNYDTLVEEAFRARGKPYDLVTYPTDQIEHRASIAWWPHGETKPRWEPANSLDIDLTKKTVIYKMHGSISADSGLDSFVVTEDDYVEFLSRMMEYKAIPTILLNYFRERSFLFLGYSLRDWNLRVVLKNISKELEKRADADNDEGPLPSWAIRYNPSELERQLWDNRKVKIFDLAIDDFVKKLKERMGR